MAMTDADADDDEKKAKIHTKYSVLLLSPLIAVSRTYDQFDKRWLIGDLNTHKHTAWKNDQLAMATMAAAKCLVIVTVPL